MGGFDGFMIKDFAVACYAEHCKICQPTVANAVFDDYKSEKKI